MNFNIGDDGCVFNGVRWFAAKVVLNRFCVAADAIGGLRLHRWAKDVVSIFISDIQDRTETLIS